MYTSFGDKAKNGIAGFADNMIVRLTNLDCITSQHLNYIAFAHEANVARLTREEGQTRVLTRGLEGLAQATYNNTSRLEGRPSFESPEP